jgi:hypothetical protein
MPLERCQSCLNAVDPDRLSHHRKYGNLCDQCFGMAYQMKSLKDQFESLDQSRASKLMRLQIQLQLKSLAEELQRRMASHGKIQDQND